mgnify:CR=1 FL=1
MKKIFILLATGFGLGYSRIMPGTVGSLLGLPICFLFIKLSIIQQVFICLFFITISIYISDKCSKIMNKKDPSCIVIDEFLTMPIVVIGLSNPFYILSGFIFHRIFDILKPPPINFLQKIPGGVGIVLDDVLSALFALLLNYIIHLSL